MLSLKNNYCLLIVSLLLSFFQVYSLKAQEREILAGKIVADSIQNMSGMHVVNLTSETGATTNDQGEFKIPAIAGDTLFISSLQFEHKKVIIKKSHLVDILIIKMRDKYNELDEVRIDDIRLSGVLSEDLDKVPKSIYEKLGMPFPKPRRTSLELATHSAYNGGNITTLIYMLNGKFKQLEKAKENNERSVMVNKGLDLVGNLFFVSQLNIKESEIINFLFYCVDEPEYSELVNKNSVLQLIDFFKLKTDSFKELRELD